MAFPRHDPASRARLLRLTGVCLVSLAFATAAATSALHVSERFHDAQPREGATAATGPDAKARVDAALDVTRLTLAALGGTALAVSGILLRRVPEGRATLSAIALLAGGFLLTEIALRVVREPLQIPGSLGPVSGVLPKVALGAFIIGLADPSGLALPRRLVLTGATAVAAATLAAHTWWTKLTIDGAEVLRANLDATAYAAWTALPLAGEWLAYALYAGALAALALLEWRARAARDVPGV